MSFSLKNFSVLFMSPDFFENNDPETDTIGTANLADIKTIGVVNSESSYKIEADQKLRSSLGVDVVYSHKLNVDLKVASDMSAAALAALDGQVKSIVLAPKSIVIPDDASDLSDAGVVIPAGVKVIVFKGDTVRITEDVKMGTMEVIPLTLSVETIATTKADLKKEFGFSLA